MKPYNKELHEDILKLKKLHAKKDKSEFNNLKAEIMQKHKISKATVYREMKKDSPGEYRLPNYFPSKMDITITEALMVRELLLAGRQVTEIIKIMGRELGINYYWDRFDAARKTGGELDESEYDPKKTYFPVKGNTFSERLLGMEFMAEDTYRKLELDGRMIKLSRESMDIIKLALMKDNPVEGEPPVNGVIAKDLLKVNELDEGLDRKISYLHRSGEIPSAYALKTLYETKEKLEKKKNLLLGARQIIIERQKKQKTAISGSVDLVSNEKTFSREDNHEENKIVKHAFRKIFKRK